MKLIQALFRTEKRSTGRLALVCLWLMSTGLAACDSGRRHDSQESGKVSVSDSTHNGKEADKGVGAGGKGYVEEGQHDVASGTDTTDTGNIPSKDSTANQK